MRTLATSASLFVALCAPAAAQGQWVEEARLLVPDGFYDTEFGRAVALSGDTALVGAPEHLERGAAFVFVRGLQGWRHQATLVPSGLPSYGRYGESVALEGNLAIVGAPQEPPGSASQGAAYVFERDAGGTWVERQRITSALSGFTDALSQSMALLGDTALLTGTTQFVASGRVFRSDAGGTWSESEAIGATDPGVVLSCALSDGFALLGTPADWPFYFENNGAVHAFERLPGGGFSPQVTFEPTDSHIAQRFGSALALLGTTALVGAEGDRQYGIDAGAAYAFERQADGSWVQVQKIFPAGGSGTYWGFGAALAAAGERLAVGAPHEFSSLPELGTVHLFERTAGAGWVETARPRPTHSAPGDDFGAALAFERDVLLVGAPNKAGAAHVFRFRPGWTGIGASGR
jgi:hypothetical protein